ncbi:MAG: bifunctional phosphoribosylaminoimidazolecarboxamide formyltransferase/IMP cyclohydrolase [Bacteriovoracaceae bacterium]|nr:bifunctional phosphoribosylaminoimidazolecarboxamide formyltransferase/IMP cyclohydrolase [Bacteriovoracaceae bacterium]
MNEKLKIKRALVSVSNKNELERLVKCLQKHNVEIISTGGTGKKISEWNIPYTSIESVTGNPEAFGGRMKTISFPILSSILFRRDNEQDLKEAGSLGIVPIDLVVCNLYPFEEVVKLKGENASEDELIENIDIGGPTMIRAAAKNHESVAIVTNPKQYGDFIVELEANNGQVGLDTRKNLALAAYRMSATYDSVICSTLEKKWEKSGESIHLSPDHTRELRYGENPHQESLLYINPLSPGLASCRLIQGKPLSHNNLLDSDAAIRCVHDLVQLIDEDYSSVVAIIKHLNPCGAALSKAPEQALKNAWEGDPISSFGSIICFSDSVTKECAIWLKDKFVEVIIAPGFSPEALDIFSKKKNLRLIPFDPRHTNTNEKLVRSVSGGWVVQSEDRTFGEEFQCMTSSPFPDEQKKLALFSVFVTKHLRSNAIGLAGKNNEGFFMAGGGMGNPNRVVSLKQCIEKARENGHSDLSNMVLASDAFFPFSDNIEEAYKAGIRYIVEPGGSIKDEEVIKTCDEKKISMVFTGRRHFKH